MGRAERRRQRIGRLRQWPLVGRHPRIEEVPALPTPDRKIVAMIRALDGTWHRPFTTLELAALQSLIDPDEHWSRDSRTQGEIDECRRRELMTSAGRGFGWRLDGTSDSAWRERIGNAVPPDAAQAIAEVMGATLLLAQAGETFVLSALPIWVRLIAMAIAVACGERQ